MCTVVTIISASDFKFLPIKRKAYCNINPVLNNVSVIRPLASVCDAT
jgi:hypothetical protein